MVLHNGPSPQEELSSAFLSQLKFCKDFVCFHKGIAAFLFCLLVFLVPHILNTGRYFIKPQLCVSSCFRPQCLVYCASNCLKFIQIFLSISPSLTRDTFHKRFRYRYCRCANTNTRGARHNMVHEYAQLSDLTTETYFILNFVNASNVVN